MFSRINTVFPASTAVFALAFRPFFLSAALFSIIALALWWAMYSGALSMSPFGGALWWHIHEMLFGFAAAVVVGFLLTAVQTWTQRPSLSRMPLVLLWGLWCAARIGLLFFPHLPVWLLALLDLAFLIAAAGVMASLVIAVRQYRNMIFVPVLLLMAFSNGLMFYAVADNHHSLVLQAAYIMVLLLALVMTVIGGRVIPMFTANGTKTEKVQPIKLLELATIVGSAALVGLVLFGVELDALVFSVVAGLVACVHFIRALRWRFWVGLGTPLVWSLHASYVCIPLTYALISAQPYWPNLSPSMAIHVLTVGGMGLMILSMMSRVSLGHTGRPIQVGSIMASAFILVLLALVVRVGALSLSMMASMPSYLTLLAVATCLWCLAYGCFLLLYFKVLTRPRIDGRPG